MDAACLEDRRPLTPQPPRPPPQRNPDGPSPFYQLVVGLTAERHIDTDAFWRAKSTNTRLSNSVAYNGWARWCASTGHDPRKPTQQSTDAYVDAVCATRARPLHALGPFSGMVSSLAKLSTTWAAVAITNLDAAKLDERQGKIRGATTKLPEQKPDLESDRIFTWLQAQIPLCVADAVAALQARRHAATAATTAASAATDAALGAPVASALDTADTAASAAAAAIRAPTTTPAHATTAAAAVATATAAAATAGATTTATDEPRATTTRASLASPRSTPMTTVTASRSTTSAGAIVAPSVATTAAAPADAATTTAAAAAANNALPATAATTATDAATAASTSTDVPPAAISNSVKAAVEAAADRNNSVKAAVEAAADRDRALARRARNVAIAAIALEVPSRPSEIAQLARTDVRMAESLPQDAPLGQRRIATTLDNIQDDDRLRLLTARNATFEMTMLLRVSKTDTKRQGISKKLFHSAGQKASAARALLAADVLACHVQGDAPPPTPQTESPLLAVLQRHSWPPGLTPLFVNTLKERTPLQPDTVSNILADVARTVTGTVVSGGKWRAAATTQLIRNGVPIESVIAQGGWSSAAALRKFYVQPSVACPDDVPRVLETQKQPAPPVATTTTCATRRSPSQPRSFSRPRRRGRTLTTSETSAGQQPDESASTTASPTRSRPHKSAPPAARDPDYSPASSSPTSSRSPSPPARSDMQLRNRSTARIGGATHRPVPSKKSTAKK